MQANGSEFEANGFHGAVEAALLQCTMELDSAYVQGDMVRGREQGHLQRRVRPPWLRGSGVSEKYDLSVRNHPLLSALCVAVVLLSLHHTVTICSGSMSSIV